MKVTVFYTGTHRSKLALKIYNLGWDKIKVGKLRLHCNDAATWLPAVSNALDTVEQNLGFLKTFTLIQNKNLPFNL